MKSYGQLCAVARALDVVGDRWTLLVVRELLLQGPSRFGELQKGLPGVATNLLAQRLRDLEEHGVVTRAAVAGDVGATAYQLTTRGMALEGVLRELLKWGAGTVPDAPADASFQMHWLGMPARYLLVDGRPDEPPATVRFGDLADGFDATAEAGRVRVARCATDVMLAATVSGPGPVLVALVQGVLGLDAALEQGVLVDGEQDAVRRLLRSEAFVAGS